VSATRSPLWRHADFRRLWIGQTISETGSRVSMLAIPLVAVLALHADAFAVGLLGTFEYLPFLLVGLPAGVWVDRLPHRAVMIVADAGRMLALGSIPVASALGHLTLAQLYAVGFVTGVLTVFFDVAYQSYLPSLVDRDRLVEGNSRLEFTRASSEVVGPGLGGLLVRAVGAPFAVAADALSYVASVLFLLRITARTAAPSRESRRSLWYELREGFSHVAGHRILRAVAGCTSWSNLVGNGANAIVILYAVQDLGLGPALIGFWFAIGSLGAPVGALLASRLVRRAGTGPAIIITSLVFSVAWIPVAFAPRSNPLPFLILSGLLGSSFGVAYNIVQVSMRQAITPHHLLGRMNATMRFFVWGTIPLGAFLGGVLGSAIGLRPAITVFAFAYLLTPLPVLFSPLRRLRNVESLMPPSDADLALETAR
jgi:MFS family permease